MKSARDFKVEVTCLMFSPSFFCCIGDQRNEWRFTQITFSAQHDYQIIIEGIVGSDYRGDIAVDDIFLSRGACPRVGKGCFLELGNPRVVPLGMLSAPIEMHTVFTREQAAFHLLLLAERFIFSNSEQRVRVHHGFVLLRHSFTSRNSQLSCSQLCWNWTQHSTAYR